MKFSDVILAVATTVVIEFLVYFVFVMASIPSMGSYWGLSSAGIVSILVAGLVVGLRFCWKDTRRIQN